MKEAKGDAPTEIVERKRWRARVRAGEEMARRQFEIAAVANTRTKPPGARKYNIYVSKNDLTMSPPPQVRDRRARRRRVARGCARGEQAGRRPRNATREKSGPETDCEATETILSGIQSEAKTILIFSFTGETDVARYFIYQVCMSIHTFLA